MNTIQVLIANKYFLTSFAIRCVLKDIKGIEVEGVSEELLIDEINKRKPDIVIVEIELIKQESFLLLKKIKKLYPSIKIIVLVDTLDKYRLIKMLREDFEGYLTKAVTKEELQKAVLKVYKGEKYYAQDISHFMFDISLYKENLKDLTYRELEILKFIIEGLSDKDIAETLYISKYTVLTHRRNIMRKLNVKSTPQLIIQSIKRGLIKVSE